jgi:hypothetical protein
MTEKQDKYSRNIPTFLSYGGGKRDELPNA